MLRWLAPVAIAFLAALVGAGLTIRWRTHADTSAAMAKGKDAADGRSTADADSAVAPSEDPTAIDTADAATAIADPFAGVAVEEPVDGPPDSPLRIVADPEQVRPMDNTPVRLWIEPRADLPDDSLDAYTEFVWHFEDGSSAVTGAEVEHTFAESARDRHITVEAKRKGQPTLTVSKRLPVERLAVVPLDDEAEPSKTGLPARKGRRLLFVTAAISDEVRLAVAQAAQRTQADAVIMAGEAADVAALDNLLQIHAPTAATLQWNVTAGDTESLPLRLLRDPQQVVTEEAVGDRATGVLAVDDIALTNVDTRAETVSEAELTRVRQALQLASAYTLHLLLSPRPLTLLRDGELIADRAYRIYQHTLKHQTAAVVSMSSGVFYDGRFGGVSLIAVGRAASEGCARLTGLDLCQPPSITLFEAGERREFKVLHLVGTGFDSAAQSDQLPPEVGTVRR